MREPVVAIPSYRESMLSPTATAAAGRPPAGLGLAGLLLLGASVAPASAASTGLHDRSRRRGDFVAQTNFVQCVGASMQMMLNMIRPGADRSAATQLTPAGAGPGVERTNARTASSARGRACVGWATGLNLLGAGPYELAGADTIETALLAAARAIRRPASRSGC